MTRVRILRTRNGTPMTDKNVPSTTRRGMMKGVGGFAALSLSNTTIAEAAEIMEGETVPADPHTLDTYRSIVDAIVPRTPELEEELGEEHVPGGLDIELEKFLIWDFNHFQEIRAEMLTTELLGRLQLDLDEDSLENLVSRLDLQRLNVLDVDGLDDVFGALEGILIEVTDTVGEAGAATIELTVETVNGVTNQVVQNYPYAPVFALVFDIVALEFLATGQNEELPGANTEFPAGGVFTKLAPRDRLRCLWTIVDGGIIDRLDDILSQILPTVGILKYVVMATNGLHGFGYYTEWSGYGETKTATPTERELVTPAGETQSRRQTDYPGPSDGYAADWRHAVPDGFADPDVDDLNLPDDLTGDDVVIGGGGDWL
jgi:hypothetical protein